MTLNEFYLKNLCTVPRIFNLNRLYSFNTHTTTKKLPKINVDLINTRNAFKMIHFLVKQIKKGKKNQCINLVIKKALLHKNI